MEIQNVIETLSVTIPKQYSPIVISKVQKARVRMGVFIQLFRIVFRKSGNVITAIKLIYGIKRKYESILGEPYLVKLAKVNDRHFWRLAAPGFPSKASQEMQTHEANRFFPNQQRTGLRSLIFAITKKCPLNCQHCCEWHNLNKEEKLATSDIIRIIHKYQDYGTTQIMLSGGEPMLRINDIYTILNAAREGTDFWVITSGIGLNSARAQKLKDAGLTGVMVSLDHYDQDKHNSFRGYEKAYSSAIEAVINANAAGLVTTLSLCATKSFVTHDNLINYMELAKELGVSFVQILEPRATGRYQGADVALGDEQLELIEKVYLEYNSSKLFADYPIINYLGFHQRKVGCFGAGDRFFYIDTDGDAHVCPFCAHKIGSVIDSSAKDMIELLGQQSCDVFKKNTVL
jgi:MoaA/NifB/PqqE/SkfB family radical SAM enzyme